MHSEPVSIGKGRWAGTAAFTALLLTDLTLVLYAGVNPCLAGAIVMAVPVAALVIVIARHRRTHRRVTVGDYLDAGVGWDQFADAVWDGNQFFASPDEAEAARDLPVAEPAPDKL